MNNADKIYNSIKGLDKISWKELYDNEVDLVKDLNKVDINKYNKGNYKGTQYIESFQGKPRLTKNQLIQIKKLAKWIKLYMIEVEGEI